MILVEIEGTNSDYLENNIVITGNFGQVQEGSTYEFEEPLRTILNMGFNLKRKVRH